ncbi:MULTISPECIES: DUF6901 family protein [unclassified Alcanivorax]|uniref:DUF6901 family protein n=1 Tax=unclassified Alcanivorax TaxID=2638842 RepID=UPI0007BAA4BD|nr:MULTISPECIES: hypothetical protein [unclassified Alcanivorax]KZX78469.1 hypothetical protein A3716_08020 [Alcanivorax sp. HI0011]KZX79568.1 hypothetical protein A3717_10080 [Alcanivorax sp. HI0013]KZY20971.1 hypothetical protein A3725_06895 [Alcanivorax sp. HI0035]KZX71463.1 hypothetical protein A3713_12450 [Alcanivorax sp. HI0003]KZX72465.1 hypothetical protein A3714_02960 [Alcanivorax sp. HI0007]
MPPDYVYTLTTPEGVQQRIPIELVDDAIAIPDRFSPPAWAALTYHQCSHCPLDKETHRYCPIALNLAYLLPESALGDSFQTVTVEVDTPQRQYRQTTTLQRALSSLFGLICALSDCPHTRFLRPMARFHLPLSSASETLVRSASLFLLQQHMADRLDSQDPLAELNARYAALNELNRCFTRRLRGKRTSDAPINALVLLNVTAREMHWNLEEELASLAPLFGNDSDA